MTAEPSLLGRSTFDATALAREHPPKLTHANKKLLFDLVAGTAAPIGDVVVSRWTSTAPASWKQGSRALRWTLSEEPFAYEPVEPSGPVVRWHMNFADQHLFAFYGGPGFGQDEVQVAEHPSLASLRERLTAAPIDGLSPMTRDRGHATPVLVMNVHRRCAIDTEPDPSIGRMRGIYGRNFARATAAEVSSAVTRISPPTRTNIVAMSSLDGGVGMYTDGQLRELLATAHSAFAACVIESRRVAGPDTAVVVHTGHWGGGAFGGDRTLLALIQGLAARTAGLDELVFHAPTDHECARAAARTQDRAFSDPATTDECIARLTAMKFRWGVPDGN